MVDEPQMEEDECDQGRQLLACTTGARSQRLAAPAWNGRRPPGARSPASRARRPSRVASLVGRGGRPCEHGRHASVTAPVRLHAHARHACSTAAERHRAVSQLRRRRRVRRGCDRRRSRARTRGRCCGHQERGKEQQAEDQGLPRRRLSCAGERRHDYAARCRRDNDTGPSSDRVCRSQRSPGRGTRQ